MGDRAQILTLLLAALAASAAVAQPGAGSLVGRDQAVEVVQDQQGGSAGGQGGVSAVVTGTALAASAFDYTIHVPVELQNMQRQSTGFTVRCDLSGQGGSAASGQSPVTAIDPATGRFSGIVTVGINLAEDASPAGIDRVSCLIKLCGGQHCAGPEPTGGTLSYFSYDPEEPHTLSVEQGI